MTAQEFQTALTKLRNAYATALTAKNQAEMDKLHDQAEQLKEQYYKRLPCRAPGCAETVREDNKHFPFCSEPHHKLYAATAYPQHRPVTRRPTIAQMEKQILENIKKRHTQEKR